MFATLPQSEKLHCVPKCITSGVFFFLSFPPVFQHLCGQRNVDESFFPKEVCSESGSGGLPMWLLCEDALVSCPHRDTMQTVSSSVLLHSLCSSCSRILDTKQRGKCHQRSATSTSDVYPGTHTHTHRSWKTRLVMDDRRRTWSHHVIDKKNNFENTDSPSCCALH